MVSTLKNNNEVWLANGVYRELMTLDVSKFPTGSKLEINASARFQSTENGASLLGIVMTVDADISSRVGSVFQYGTSLAISGLVVARPANGLIKLQAYKDNDVVTARKMTATTTARLAS